MNTQSDKPRETVLVVPNADGWIGVYGGNNIDVQIAMMPHMTTPEGERLAEQYLELTLPKRYRDLYFPGNLRAADMVRTITPQDIAKQKWDMTMLKAMDGIAASNGNREVTTWIA